MAAAWAASSASVGGMGSTTVVLDVNASGGVYDGLGDGTLPTLQRFLGGGDGELGADGMWCSTGGSRSIDAQERSRATQSTSPSAADCVTTGIPASRSTYAHSSTGSSSSSLSLTAP